MKELGAVYSGQLERGLTSFLVSAQGIRSDGVAKVQKAREWRIPVVRVEWIYSSLEQACFKRPILHLQLLCARAAADLLFDLLGI